jgi:hypothetical protein
MQNILRNNKHDKKLSKGYPNPQKHKQNTDIQYQKNKKWAILTYNGTETRKITRPLISFTHDDGQLGRNML